MASTSSRLISASVICGELRSTCCIMSCASAAPQHRPTTRTTGPRGDKNREMAFISKTRVRRPPNAAGQSTLNPRNGDHNQSLAQSQVEALSALEAADFAFRLGAAEILDGGMGL